MKNQNTMNTTNHPFTIFVDGNYYQDDAELTVSIPLSDDDVATIQRLLGQHKGPLNSSTDLMPILKAGAPKLHQRFFDAIYPRVFFELFDLDLVAPDLDSDSADWHRQWDFDRDIDYMLATYGDAVDLSDAYLCRIPEQFIQKTNKKQ